MKNKKYHAVGNISKTK